MTTSIKIRKSDLVKFELVKSLILEDIMVHHTITELSHRSGLNEFKLKVGFKLLFKQPIYGFLQDHRMKQSLHLLSTSEESIQQIAIRCGYGYATNFAAVFRKKFKIKPSDYRRIQYVNTGLA